jgi:ribosomal protein S18 acetylase RimI-like enzyme
MPSLTDRAQIRSILSADKAWAVYALGDLAGGFYEHTSWFGSADGSALLMLYRAFGAPLLFAFGPPDRVAPLLAEIEAETDVYLSVRPEILPLIEAHFQISDETPMWRMILDPARFQPAAGPAVRLSLADLPALQRLYAGGSLDGPPAGDGPDFFSASMVEQGVYYGIYAETELLAAAGTHLVVLAEGVSAVGSVYTQVSQRGRGLATQVTGAVAAELLSIPTLRHIALNVRQDNPAALAVYERLGFQRYCAFYEGRARR